MSIFKKLGWCFKQAKKSYIIGVFSLMMFALVQLVPPKVIGVDVDEIVNKEIRLTKIILCVALLIGAGLAQYLFR
ncbi:multidrug ABC transporter permease/ATP-binding protein, partial [Enterococcus faecalis]